MHRGSLAINFNTFKVKHDLSALLPVKWLKFSVLPATVRVEVLCAHCAVVFACISCINVFSNKLQSSRARVHNNFKIYLCILG